MKTVDEGIMLLETDDAPDLELDLVDEESIGRSGLPPQTRRAIIVEKAQGMPSKLVGLRYGLTAAVVQRVYDKFVENTVDVRRLSDENPDVFKHKVRRKAVDAIESGLDCDRDPYRRAALGMKVMTGIGEFQPENGGGTGVPGTVNVNVLVGSVPSEWSERYIITSGSPTSTAPKLLKE